MGHLKWYIFEDPLRAKDFTVATLGLDDFSKVSDLSPAEILELINRTNQGGESLKASFEKHPGKQHGYKVEMPRITFHFIVSPCEDGQKFGVWLIREDGAVREI